MTNKKLDSRALSGSYTTLGTNRTDCNPLSTGKLCTRVPDITPNEHNLTHYALEAHEPLEPLILPVRTTFIVVNIFRSIFLAFLRIL